MGLQLQGDFVYCPVFFFFFFYRLKVCGNPALEPVSQYHFSNSCSLCVSVML